MIVYKLRLPLTLLLGFAMGCFSVWLSFNQSWWPFILIIVINFFPVLVLISKHSKNPIFDELLYYVCLMASYLIAVFIFSDKASLSALNLLGLLIAFVGFVLMKYKPPENKPQGEM